MQPNQWLRQAVAELKERYTDDELRAQYDKSLQAHPENDWEDFLWDKALHLQLELHPVLKTRTDDMPFREHTKDIFKANYIDALVLLVQLTDKELERLPGLSSAEREEITDYLSSLGFSLSHGEDETLMQAWEECYEERRGVLNILETLKTLRKQAREEEGTSLNEKVAKEVSLYEDADSLLLVNNADMGTKQRFLREYACFLYDNMSTCPDETAGALDVAKREYSLKKYLYGPGHPMTGPSLELMARICQEMGDYASAIPYYERALAIRKKDKDADRHDTADLYQALGICRLEIKDYEECHEAFNKAYDIYMYDRPMCPDRISLGHLCYLIADAYREQGDMEQFREYAHRAKLFQDK